MGTRRVRRVYLLVIWTVLSLAGGCRDAVREGVTAGVTDGIAGMIESWITSGATTALGAERHHPRCAS